MWHESTIAVALTLLVLIPAYVACGFYFIYLCKDGNPARLRLPMAIWLNWITGILAMIIRYLADQNVFPKGTSTLDKVGDVLNGTKFENAELHIKYEKMILPTLLAGIFLNTIASFYYYTVMKRLAAMDENKPLVR